jgi:hypothetical protein
VIFIILPSHILSFFYTIRDTYKVISAIIIATEITCKYIIYITLHRQILVLSFSDMLDVLSITGGGVTVIFWGFAVSAVRPVGGCKGLTGVSLVVIIGLL